MATAFPFDKLIPRMNVFSILVVIMVVFILMIIYFIYDDKKRYVYKVRIFQTRENGSVKEINCKGGYINNKLTGINKFVIKRGFFPFNKIILKTTPDPSMIDFENRIYYKQIDVSTFIQLKRVFDRDILIYKPAEQDIMYGAVLTLQNIDKALKNQGLWEKALPFISMGIVFVLAIVGWWFVMNAKCPSLK